jgi:O-antigen ligase
MFKTGIFALFSLAVSILVLIYSPASLCIALILIIFPIIALHPEIFFIIFFLVRPTLDLAAEKGHGCVNLAAIFTLSLISICGLALLRRNNLSFLGKNDFLKKFNALFFLFIFFSLPSFLNTDTYGQSIAELLRLFSIPVAVNYSIIYFSKNGRRFHFSRLLLYSCVIPLIFGFYQFLFQKGVFENGFNRLNGTFLHPNVFAQYLTIIFCILLYIIFSGKMKPAEKLLVFGAVAIVMFELLFTFTRSAWIAVFMVSLTFIFLKTKPAQNVKYVLIMVLILAAAFPFVSERFSDIHQDSHDNLSSWQWRLKQWNETFSSLRNHFFIGNGIGMHGHDFLIMAHNDYLRIAYETGVFGVVFYLLFLLYILYKSLKRVLKSITPLAINRAKAAFALILSLVLMSASDNLARSTVILFYLFIGIGYFLGTAENERALNGGQIRP